MLNTDVSRVADWLNDSSFWTITRPGRWVAADGSTMETQYVLGEGTVTLYVAPQRGKRKVVWQIRGVEVFKELMNMVTPECQ